MYSLNSWLPFCWQKLLECERLCAQPLTVDPQGRDLTQVHRSNVGQIVQNLSTSLCWQVSKQVKISFSYKCYNWSCANFKNTTKKKKSLFSVIHGRNVFLSIECHGVVKVSWLFFGKVVILAYFLGWYLFKDDCTYTGFGVFLVASVILIRLLFILLKSLVISNIN